MRTWTPVWTVTPPVGHHPADVSWFGGVPDGLSTDLWPVCGECGTVMTPLVQLAAGPWLPRVPEAHVLLVFKCESEDVCSFWDPDDVANRTLVVSGDDLGRGAPLPTSVADGTTRVLPRLWVRTWAPTEEPITPEQADAVDDPRRWWDLPDEVTAWHGYETARLTKAGGAPCWTGNGPSSEPPRPRRLLFQIDSWLVVDDPAEQVAEALTGTVGPSELHGVRLSAANFMSDGIAYLFDTTPDAPWPTPRMVITR